MQKTMMILGASALQVPAIKKAKQLGYRIILVDYDKDAVGFPLADVKLVVSTLDKEEVLRQALIYKPDVVLTSTSDGPVRTAAYVNEKLGKKPDLSYEDSLCATIKSNMRDRLKEFHLPIPRYYVTHNFDEYQTAVNELNGYCIVKPADNAGSRGVVLIENASDEKIKEVYEFSKSNSKNGVVMVEEFMTGQEVSVESLTIEGNTTIITITDKITTPPPFFVEIGHSEPSNLPINIQEEIIRITKEAAKAIGFINCPSHTEMKITKDGPKIVEIAARLGGDFITSKLVPLSTGVDLVGNSIILATGGKVDIDKKINKGSAICFIQSKQGTIQNIEIEKNLENKTGIEEIVLYKKIGDHIHDTQSSNDRLGHIVATADTADEALQIATDALKGIKITIAGN